MLWHASASVHLSDNPVVCVTGRQSDVSYLPFAPVRCCHREPHLSIVWLQEEDWVHGKGLGLALRTQGQEQELRLPAAPWLSTGDLVFASLSLCLCFSLSVLCTFSAWYTQGYPSLDLGGLCFHASGRDWLESERPSFRLPGQRMQLAQPMSGVP